MSEKLLVSKIDGVLTLALNKPEVRNAIDNEVMTALYEAIIAAKTDDESRVILLTGSGGHFCTGADVKQLMHGLEDDDRAMGDRVYRTLTEVYGPVLLAIRHSPKPVIAAVEGYAAGFGCDLALRCDIRLVSETAIFSELFIRVGLIPDGGGTYLLPRLVGMGRALELMMTGKNVGAEEAVQIGLANRMFPTNIFGQQVQEYAKSLAQQAPLALARGKQVMLAALEGSFEEALLREAETQQAIFNTGDGLEGFRAFLEKRPPQWKGR
jgi:2-(1,2-epoxy-1,2-dihydrophenyl)acetyl-CoA isomerase